MPLFSWSFNWDNNCMLTALMLDNRRTIIGPNLHHQPIGIYKMIEASTAFQRLSCCIVVEWHLYFPLVLPVPSSLVQDLQYKALYHDFIISFVATKVEDNLQVGDVHTSRSETEETLWLTCFQLCICIQSKGWCITIVWITKFHLQPPCPKFDVKMTEKS